MGFERLASLGGGTYQLDSGYLGDGYTAVYLIVDGGRCAVFDTAHSASAVRLGEALAELGLAAEDIDYVYVSHVHLDHCGGAGHYARLLPDARIICHPRAAPHLADPAKLIAGARSLYGERFDSLYGEILPVPADRIEEAAEGAEHQLGERTLETVHAAGHTFHHICVIDRAGDICHTGDAFSLRLPAAHGVREVCRVASAPTQFAPDQWRETARRLSRLGVGRLTVAHCGAVSGDLAAHADEICADLDAFEGFAREAAGKPDAPAFLADHIRRRWEALMWPDGDPQQSPLFDVDVMLAAAGLAHWMGKHMTS